MSNKQTPMERVTGERPLNEIIEASANHAYSMLVEVNEFFASKGILPLSNEQLAILQMKMAHAQFTAYVNGVADCSDAPQKPDRLIKVSFLEEYLKLTPKT